MARRQSTVVAFNRGRVSRLGLARGDIKRIAMGAQISKNWMPRALGSMMIRPGTAYVGATASNAKARLLPFVFSNGDKAIIEITNGLMRVWVNDTPLTRPFAGTTITNPNFTSNITGWTTSSANVTWSATGALQIVSPNETYETATQEVVPGIWAGGPHSLVIEIERGPVVLRVGSTSGADDYIAQTTLDTGTHNLTFTPAGNFWIRFQSLLQRQVRVSSCNIGTFDVITITAPWQEADLGLLRYAQSGDIIYVACGKTTDKIGYQPRKIERRSATSWSLVTYHPNDGPFLTQNTEPTTMTASVATDSGNGTLTASASVFKAGHVGALFSLDTAGQEGEMLVVNANDTFTEPIRIIGVGTTRDVSIIITGNAAGSEVRLQRSTTGDAGPWTLVAVYTLSTTYNDGLANQEVWYRLASLNASGDWNTPDSVTALVSSTQGIVTSVGRVTSLTSGTVANIEVLQRFQAPNATTDWSEGRWSNQRGWPTSVQLHEGRLSWFGRDLAALSVSDDYQSFDETIETDAAPILRTIGAKAVDTINWAMPLQQLIIGGGAGEYACRSSSLNEPLTLTNTSVKPLSTQGSAAIDCVLMDDAGAFVQRGGRRVMGVSLSPERGDYTVEDLTRICPEIGDPGITCLAVQRQPDTRIHCVRSDGTVAVLVFEPDEQVACWVDIETPAASGVVEEVCVLPGDDGEDEDRVYYVVRRTINGSTVRYIERWAHEEDCVGGALNLMADCHKTYTGPAQQDITNLGHLEGQQVVVWANGSDVGHDANDARIYTVTGNKITLATAATNVVVGLPYDAPWKGQKLGSLQFQDGSHMRNRIIKGLGLLMADTHRKGLQFGQDFTTMRDLPGIEGGAAVGANEVRADYDEPPMTFPGVWSHKAELCLQGKAPRPATVLGAVIEFEEH